MGDSDTGEQDHLDEVEEDEEFVPEGSNPHRGSSKFSFDPTFGFIPDMSAFLPKVHFPIGLPVLPTLTSQFTHATGVKLNSGFSDAVQAALGPIVSGVHASLGGLAVPLIPFQFQALFGSLPDFDLRRTALPANIAASEVILDVKLLRQWMDEGLPIAHVPRAETLNLVAEASTAASRRVIYGRRWRGILQDCEDLLDDAQAAETAPMVEQARKAIAGVRAGHSDLAQAFAGSALDTAVKKAFSPIDYSGWVSSKNPNDPETQSLRRFFMVAPLQAVHRSYFPQRGDSVPATFNRHATAHAVGLGRQYSRVNAVLAISHLTSFIWFIDLEFSRGAAR